MLNKTKINTTTKINSTTILSLILKISILFISIISVYYHDINSIMNEVAHNEFMNYMISIPFLISYVIYRKRKILLAVSTNDNQEYNLLKFYGPLLCGISIFLYWYGSYNVLPIQQHMISMPIFTAGCILILFNYRLLKELAFPLISLFFFVPLNFEIITRIGTKLSILSSSLSYYILKLLGIPVSIFYQYEMPILILKNYQDMPITFAIDIPCAGFYSLSGFVIFALFTAYIARDVVWKKTFLFAIGLPLIYGLNIVRIVIIILIGLKFGENLALQTFHLFGGWMLIFVGTLFLLILSEKILRINLFSRKTKNIECLYCANTTQIDQKYCNMCGKIQKPIEMKIEKTDLYKIVLLTLSIGILVYVKLPYISITEINTNIDLQNLGMKQGYLPPLPEQPDYELKYAYRDTEFEELFGQDVSIAYLYMPLDNQKIPIWVTMEIAGHWGVLHRWEVCLGDQPDVIELDLRKFELSMNPPITGRYYAIQRSDTIQVILYWYERFLLKTENLFERKYIKTSLIAYLDNPENVSEVEEVLLPVAEDIINYWLPAKTGARITLIMSQYGTYLILIMIILLIIPIIISYIQYINIRSSNYRKYKRLFLEEEKRIIKSVQEANNKGRSTTMDVALIYNGLKSLIMKMNQY